MSVFARPSELRRAAGDYDKAASDCLDVVRETSACAKELSAAISEASVEAALSAAMLTVLRQLQLVGGACTYSSAQLEASATSYDASDEAAARHLAGLLPRVG